MTTLEKIQQLNDKIADAIRVNSSYDFSINNSNQPGGSWKDSIVRNCGVSWKANTANPGDSKIKDECFKSWNIVTDRTNAIALNEANILAWKNEIEQLEKDPQFITDTKNRQTKNGVIITIVIIAIVSIGLFLWKKYKK